VRRFRNLNIYGSCSVSNGYREGGNSGNNFLKISLTRSGKALDFLSLQPGIRLEVDL